MEMISCRDIHRYYRMNGLEVKALKGVTLEIAQGEFAALAGPSGSGKTTLLNIIGGLDAATTGNVAVGGTALDGLSPKKLADIRLHKIGFIFQAYNLIPVLTAVENVSYVLLLQGVDKKERTERSMRVLAEVGLEKEANRRPHELSGGQQQRVAVARAVVSEPEVVLADEPTANLDQKTGEQLLTMMQSLNRKNRTTFLFSTHDPMVMNHSKRLIRLIDGKIIADETQA